MQTKKGPKGPISSGDAYSAALLAGDEEAPVIRSLLTILEAHLKADGADQKQHGNYDNHVGFLSLWLHAAPVATKRQQNWSMYPFGAVTALEKPVRRNNLVATTGADAMLYAFLGLPALIGMLAACRFLSAKAAMTDSDRLELDARRMLGDIRADDVQQLREENTIMRNLLLDIIENEASLANCYCPTEQARRFKSRASRRRELFGEAVVFLDKSAGPKIQIPQSAN